MNVLLLTSHSIAEHDDLDMFARMGVRVFSIGAYTNPSEPGDDKRPALYHAPYYPRLEAATDAQRALMHGKYGDPGSNIDWGKARLAPEVIDWADTIIVHHFPEQWIGGNWDKIHDKRVIWRTCGQSDPRLEASMFRYARQGMQIVRYSPKEAPAFIAAGAFAGEDVTIRFGKDPEQWGGWTGDLVAVGNITQHMRQRGDACGYAYWEEATVGLPRYPAGPGSEVMDGVGTLPFDRMQDYLRRIRAYLYTGTRPASYTLGLIEAMMTGTPVVAMGAGAFYPAALWEGADIVGVGFDSPIAAGSVLRDLLDDPEYAADMSAAVRARAIELFDLGTVSAQWADFLGIAA